MQYALLGECFLLGIYSGEHIYLAVTTKRYYIPPEVVRALTAAFLLHATTCTDWNQRCILSLVFWHALLLGLRKTRLYPTKDEP
jgi:hypothetical protein